MIATDFQQQSVDLCRAGGLPGAYRDVVHVLRWVHDRGARHGLDRRRCTLFGCSSGGQLVSSRATGEERGIASIRAAVSYAGVMDMAAWHHESRAMFAAETAALALYRQ